MKTFVLVTGGVVTHVLEAETLADLASVARDEVLVVTGQNPLPAVGERWQVTQTGSVFTSGFVKPPVPPPLPMEPQREAARNRIDRECGACRLQFITDVPGQPATYQLKSFEVDLWNADMAAGRTPQQTPTRYPYLNRESIATDRSLLEVKMTVQALRDGWTEIGSRIEGLRLGAKKRATDATTAADIAAIFPIDWPSS